MENQANATNVAQIERGAKRTETSIIRNVTFNPNFGKDGSYILHGTPTKSNPKGIWAISKKVFENLAASAMVPTIVYAEQIKGAKYTVNSEFVKVGDAWKRGTGVYSKDHFTTISTDLERSKASVEADRNIMLNAYYSAQFAGTLQNVQSSVAAPKAESVPVSHEGNESAEEIQA